MPFSLDQVAKRLCANKASAKGLHASHVIDQFDSTVKIQGFCSGEKVESMCSWHVRHEHVLARLADCVAD
jgi:hypothetical protein